MKSTILKSTGKIFLAGMLLLGAGCSDFLDEQDPSNLTPESFYTIPAHAEAAIAAVYDNTRFYGDGAGIFSSNWQLLEAPTGTSTTETAQNSDLNNLYSLTWDGNTGHIKNWWRGIYRVIAQANLALDKVPGITPMDEAQKTTILGEAHFLRAWAYFYAVRLWGDVPLVLTPQSASSEDFFPVRTPQEAVYEQIIADLKAAEAAGLPWTDASGRVSTAAAKAMLSKVYLTMAGHPLNKGEAYYQLAADKAKEIIDDPGTIGLFATYSEVHDESLDNTKEHIFSLQYNDLVAGNPMGNMFPNFKPVSYRGPSGTGSTVPTLSFYESYEAGDIRTVDQEGYFYTTYYTNGNGEPFDLGAPYIFKHFNVTANGSPGKAGTAKDNLNVPMIRYAEVLLIYAEAQNEISGPTAEALNALKSIRDRAGLATPALGAFNQSTFREAVWKERWHELCYEGITWFDMVRLRKVFNETTKGFDNFVGHVNLNSNQALQEKHLLFPIPIQEMQNNPNLTPQNPGYD
ncbi:putative outer membrane starch-binding protein [Anseongella ginsenosidimutans]|uniref:Putative outer membrane starch-binding protein n=1 Tax=Anseongella ginsenosidimutans TaxID=496056 RepID=A0A4R3KXT6_9SPHI|nr:RagB/SusD family nutrient uptake outer membrane protein [Anseongella ginsenosidimutans]QEC51106.1 RagB/SusD family nutrient uptake outer membrane protein [Anseongella ginsenosidimutans]TCS90231.1 putative outer membrane starch-binding protein [Anseongella ginsenosidimutans]